MTLNTDFVINANPLGTTYSPFASTIASLPDGSALVAWVTVADDVTTDSEIHARWIKPDGSFGEEFVVNSTTEGFQWRPVATLTAEDKVFLAWESGDPGDGDGLTVRGALIDPLINEAGPDFILNSSAAGNQSQVEMTALGDGRVFALWTSFDGSDGDGLAVRGRYFAADGTALGDDLLINTTGVGGQMDPHAAVLSDGRILVTFTSTDDADGTPGCVRGRIIAADGRFKGDDFVINSTAGGYQSYVDVTALADGKALVVWFSSGLYADDPEGGNGSFGPGEVRARIIGADGQPEGADFQVNSTDLDFPYAKPAVTTLPDGRIFVVWHSGDAGDGDWGSLRGRVIEANGQLVESDFVINTTGVNNQSSPAVAALQDGRVLVTWSSDDGGASGALTRGLYVTPSIGNASADRIVGSAGQDIQMGLAGNDRLSGLQGDDQLMGGRGKDVLKGGTGTDILDGGTGSDLLRGGAGADVLAGGRGDDALYGGAGADVFVFSTLGGHDKIGDFRAGDHLQIAASLWSGSTLDFVASHASVTEAGVLLHLSANSDILLVGLTQTTGLADALLFF